MKPWARTGTPPGLPGQSAPRGEPGRLWCPANAQTGQRGAGGFGAGGPCSLWRRGEGSAVARRGPRASGEVEWRPHHHLLCEPEWRRPGVCGLQQARVGAQGGATREPCAFSTPHVLLATAMRRAPLGPAVRLLPVPGAGSLRSRRGQAASSRPQGSMGSGPTPSSRWWPVTQGFPKRHPTCLPAFGLLPLTGRPRLHHDLP